jgi:cell division transport system permease protein
LPAIFVVLSVALINNTIRLAIYSQRFLIKSMQLVGATKGLSANHFCFMASGMAYWAVNDAVLILIGTLYLAYQQIPDLVILQNYTEFGIVFLGVIGIGVLCRPLVPSWR